MNRLLLLGAGHAQLAVLAALARQRMPGAEVLLVSPGERLITRLGNKCGRPTEGSISGVL